MNNLDKQMNYNDEINTEHSYLYIWKGVKNILVIHPATYFTSVGKHWTYGLFESILDYTQNIRYKMLFLYNFT